jgi:hypothetical protein
MEKLFRVLACYVAAGALLCKAAAEEDGMAGTFETFKDDSPLLSPIFAARWTVWKASRGPSSGTTHRWQRLAVPALEAEPVLALD